MYQVCVMDFSGLLPKYTVASLEEARDAMALLIWNNYNIGPDEAREFCKDRMEVTSDDLADDGYECTGDEEDFEIVEVTPDAWDFNWPKQAVVG